MDLKRLRELVVEVKPSLASKPIQATDSLSDDLGLDSLDFFQLGDSIEQGAKNDFALDKWVEAEKNLEGKRFTLESLLRAVDTPKP